MSPSPSDVANQPSRGRRGFRLFLLIWMLLLLASHVWRWTQPDANPKDHQVVVELPRFDSDGPARGQSVSMAFTDAAARDSVSTPILLIHGSPAGSGFMMRLHAALADQSGHRVLTPDLPGFEGSSKRIPDYSVRAHARYLDAMLDSLDIPRVHLIGYSMGGGVASEAMRLWPDRIESVTMLSAIGVQEMELLGDYHLNHGIHGLQLAGLWTLTYLVPHFGWMDDAMLGLPYARNFFDTDQRPFREILNTWAGPLLIVHGDDDPLVPLQAALEHHRIIPHSVLVRYEGKGHGLPITDPALVATDIVEWLDQVDTDQALRRDQATPERSADAAVPFDPAELPPATGFSLWILVFLLALSTLVSEDLASISAGLMAARGTIGFEHALFAAFAGILVGDVMLYFAGRLLGRRIVTLPPFSWFISEAQLQRGADWFDRKGGRVVIASRFIPGSRFPTYVAAGTLKAPFWTFLFYFMIGTILWTPVIVGVSTILGQQILDFWTLYEDWALWVLIGVILSIYALFHIGLPMLSHMGRRRQLSRWRRLTRWEFWPPFVFYPPVLLHVAWLAFKHRSLTVFTAANPGIDTGGFLGESKIDIMDLMQKLPSQLPAWAPVRIDVSDSPADRADKAVTAFRDAGLAYPVVLKPDVGDRGHRVVIARSEADLITLAAEFPSDFLIQSFVGGEEFGVFAIRRPGADSTRVFSITEKRLIHVEGDGKRTLERLILDDDRAVCMAPTFVKRFAADLDRVLEAGEVMKLVDVGTHSRGALFLDAGDHITPELEAEMHAIVSAMPGFFFGRFDVKVPDRSSLAAGRDLKILEVNGVSSEATHIYHPGTPLTKAYRILREQWSQAFEIGVVNQQLGARPTSLSDLLRRIFRWKIQPQDKPDSSAAARS